MEQIRPKWQELQAKANEMMAAKKSAQEARDTLAEQTKHLKPIADALRPAERLGTAVRSQGCCLGC